MPSFLVNDRMNPELKRRVRLSLKSDLRQRAGGQSARRGHWAVRLMAVLGVISLGTFLTVTYRQSRAELRQEKAQLLVRFEQQRAPFDAAFRGREQKVEQLLIHAHEPYAGDWLDPQLKRPGALDALLAPSLAYVRGPLRGFLSDAERRQTSKEAGPEALIRCLIDPPSSIKESEILRHLGRIYEPKRFIDKFYDFEAARGAFAFVDSGCEDEIRQADRMKHVLSLGRELREQKLGVAAQVRQVRLLIAVFDEPKERGVAADFDGEATHYLRISVVDLDTPRVWWRVRRQVDPQWISEKSRLAYSRELDSCRLAYELRQELSVTLPQGGN